MSKHINADLFSWIPIEERLPDPKEYDWVLGAVKTTEDGWYLPPHIVELRNGEWWALGDDNWPLSELNCIVTHWMPLPPNPKEV